MLDQGYVTTLSGHTLRISEREVSSYTVGPIARLGFSPCVLSPSIPLILSLDMK